jgi:hypothetical protein
VTMWSSQVHSRGRATASDPVNILDPEQGAQTPPFACGKCGTVEHMQVKLLMPSLGDYGAIEVRRPAGVKKTQMWRTEKLGDTPLAAGGDYISY